MGFNSIFSLDIFSVVIIVGSLFSSFFSIDDIRIISSFCSFSSLGFNSILISTSGILFSICICGLFILSFFSCNTISVIFGVFSLFILISFSFICSIFISSSFVTILSLFIFSSKVITISSGFLILIFSSLSLFNIIFSLFLSFSSLFFEFSFAIEISSFDSILIVLLVLSEKICSKLLFIIFCSLSSFSLFKTSFNISKPFCLSDFSFSFWSLSSFFSMMLFLSLI